MHKFRQHGAKTRSFCMDCQQPESYQEHPGGTEPLKPRVGATMTVEGTASKPARKKAGAKKSRKA